MMETSMMIVLCLIVASTHVFVQAKTDPPNSLQTSRLMSYVGKSHESLLNLTAEPCYCSFWTCYYCPGNFFCTVDHTGCCAYPGCRNSCGRWCLCPKYPICCPDGACSESAPKCCGNKCCGKAESCCDNEGNHCCGEEETCCGKGCCNAKAGKCCSSSNSDEKLCCLKESTAEKNTPEEAVGEHVEKSDVQTGYTTIFKDLCLTFKELLPNKVSNKQYAVLLAGGTNLSPKPEEFDPAGQVVGSNYAAAQFTGHIHTEETILKYADKLVRDYKQKHNLNPMLFLYTKHNPCCGKHISETCNSGCAGKIASKLRELSPEISTMVIAWDVNYKLGAMPFDKAFLFSLNSMLSPGNARLSWTTDGFCRVTPRGWFQNKMFECLAEKVKGHPFCKPESLTHDLARLVNVITWKCGTKTQTDDSSYPERYTNDNDIDDDDNESGQSDSKPVGVPPAREPQCWQDKAKFLDKASDSKCSCLVKSAFDCATTHQEEDLGPALAPGKPPTISDSANDVRGDYTTPLCFTAGSCHAPKTKYSADKELKSSQMRGQEKEEL